MKAYMVHMEYKSGLKNMIMEYESGLKIWCVIFEIHIWYENVMVFMVYGMYYGMPYGWYILREGIFNWWFFNT